METDTERVIDCISLDKILSSSKSLLIVLFPSYEDRALALIEKIRNIKSTGSNLPDISFLMFCLKNKNNNNILLEDLKKRNIESIKTVIQTNITNAYFEEFWLEYPSNFSSNELKRHIQEALEKKKRVAQEDTDILCDISTVPKTILFYLCETIKEYLCARQTGRIYFTYSLPKKYSEVPYAQDIGLLKGLFSGGALQISEEQCIRAILFPSRTGNEARLLCDSLDSISRDSSYSVYFPIYKDNFMDSLDIMRANQSLINRESYMNYFYSTLDDALKKLDELFQKEYTKIKHLIESGDVEKDHLMNVLYLIAPFREKLFLPATYFELLHLRSLFPKLISVEIANVRGFQYTSTYSLGIGAMTCFELNGGKIANDLCENQNL